MQSAGLDDSFSRRVFQQAISRKQEQAVLQLIAEWDSPRTARTNKRFPLLSVGEVHVSSVLENQPNTGIAHARPENLLWCDDRDSTSRFTGNRVPGNGRVHLAKKLRARVGGAQQGCILPNRLHCHACRLRSAAPSPGSIGDTEHNSLTVVNDKSA